MSRKRFIEPKLRKLFSQYPVVTITGPRQSGKTTLCKKMFPKLAYVSLENADVRQKALRDPNGFLKEYHHGAIFDEIQRAPELLSYIQTDVDASSKTGRYLITGSAQLALLANLSQSLAGRTSLTTLLPFSFEEAYPKQTAPDLDTVLYTGFFPRIFDKRLDPTEAMASYCGTYIDRDVRAILNIKDLSAFETFLKLCANRTAHILNFSNLAADAGINHVTAHNWMSVLEASCLIFRLQPHMNNLNKRLIKAPKIHIVDTGLACYLMNIENVRSLRHHPLKGSLFETFVVMELIKQRFNQSKRPNLYYWRDNTGNEIDVIMDFGGQVLPIEIKSGTTVAPDFFKNVDYYRKLNSACKKAAIVYGGTQTYETNNTWVVSYRDIGLFSALDDRLKLPL